MGKNTQILGHRGASAVLPENTIAAFRLAVALEADGVELDVRRAGDGALVVCHNARLPDGRVVRSTPRHQLPATVPTLAEVLEAGPWFVNIEVKVDPGGADPDATSSLAGDVVAEVAARQAGERVLVSSFDVALLHQVQRLDPALAVGWLVASSTISSGRSPARRRTIDDLVAQVESHGFTALHPADALVESDLVRRAHQAGLAVNVWTVDDADRIRELADLGVDAVITNDPATARAALNAAPDARS